MLNRVRLVSGLLLTSCMLILGCNNENKEFPAQVSGKVSYKGSPVTGGIITLYTAEGSPIQAPISNNGTYLFPNLPVGQMTVTIDTDSVNPETMKKEDYTGGKGPGAGPGGIPAGMYKKSVATPSPTLKKGQVATKEPLPEGAQTNEAIYVKIPAKYKAKGTSGLTIELKAGKQTKDFELND